MNVSESAAARRGREAMKLRKGAAARLVAAAVAVGAGCDALPRDPEGTLERVRGGTLRAGAISNPPWVVIEGDDVSGIEAELVEALAEEVGAEVAWTPASERDHMLALENWQLDLVAGGISPKTPWKKHVALSRPHARIENFVGARPGAAVPGSIDDRAVAAKKGSALIGELAAMGGDPVPADDPLDGSHDLVAAPLNELRGAGFQVAEIRVSKEEKALALPPGENAWVRRVDTFLHRKEGKP